MGEAGRAHATRRFTLRRMIDRTTGVYDRVLASRAAPLRKASSDVAHERRAS